MKNSLHFEQEVEARCGYDALKNIDGTLSKVDAQIVLQDVFPIAKCVR